jgi:hypothetical protein
MNNEYLKSIDFISIDYTSKISDFQDLNKLLIKCFNPKYNNIIFYINLSKLSKQMQNIIKLSVNCSVESKNITVYFNKDNYVYYANNYILPINKINEFINIGDNLLKCDVCFKNNLINIGSCHKCDFKICSDCAIKSIRTKDRTTGIKNVDCLACGYTNGILNIAVN